MDTKLVKDYSKNKLFSADNILVNLPFHVYWLDINNRIMGCNEHQAAKLGIPRNEIIGKKINEVISKKEAKEIEKTNKEVITSGQEKEVEEKYRKHVFLSRKLPLKNSQNKIIGLIGISTDITKQKHEQKKQLQKSQKDLKELRKVSQQITNASSKQSVKEDVKNALFYLESIIANIPGSVFWKDTNGCYLGCNDYMANVLKLNDRYDIIGKTDYDLSWKDKANELMKNDKKVMQAGKSVYNIEEVGKLANETLATYLTSKAPLRNIKGEIVGVLGTSFDITSRKKTEEELHRAKEAAEKANKLKSQFVSDMEHDIRTPTSGIAEMTKMLASNEPNPTRKEQLGYVAEASKQLLELLNNILAFDYIESGRTPILNKKFSLQDTIHNVLALEEPAAELKKLDLNIKIAPNIPKHLIGDEYRLKRILINLVGNSVKFTEKGYIKITAELLQRLDDKNCLLKIKVVDTGMGIPQEKQNVLYEKFTRGTASNKGSYPGAGLGLRIVRQFIEEIDGEIEVESTVNLGTTFSCTIPYQIPLADRVVEKTATENKPPQTNEEKKTSPLSILLVEDDKLAQTIAGEMLYNKFKVNAVIVPDGEKALKIAASIKYDLIFMDIGLPDITGYEVTKQIRNHPKKRNLDTPIVALTAHDVKNASEEAVASGMSDFLVKPLTVEKVEKVFAKWLVEKPKKVTNVKPLISETLQEKPPVIDNKVINITEALKIVGKMETLKELLKILTDMMPEYRQPIEDAFAVKDYSALSDAAHKLTGASSYCGTIKLTELARDIEVIAKKGDKEAAKISNLVQQILSEMDAVLNAYSSIVELL